jgi:hypothetical protein
VIFKEGSKYWSVEAEYTMFYFVVATRFSLELRSLPCVSVAAEPSCEYIKAVVVLSMRVSILKPEAVIYRCLSLKEVNQFQAHLGF